MRKMLGVAPSNAKDAAPKDYVDSCPYKFSAYHNTTQSVADGAKVSFNTEDFDTGGNFASSRFTAPVAGFYQFNAQIFVQSGSTGTNRLLLFKNGSHYSTGDTSASSGGNDVSLGIGGLIQLAATDYIEVFFGVSSGPKTLFGTAGIRYTWFTGNLTSLT